MMKQPERIIRVKTSTGWEISETKKLKRGDSFQIFENVNEVAYTATSDPWCHEIMGKMIWSVEIDE